MLTPRSLFIVVATGLLLPLLAVAALLWQRLYHEHENNTARRVFKNSLVPTVMRMLVRALDMLFALVLYDTLSPNDIGTYELAALLIVSYLGTFADFGLGVLLTREVAKDSTARQELFGATLVLRLLLVVATVPLIAGVIGAYQLFAGLELGEAIDTLGRQTIWILALTLVPSAFSNAVTALYNANERMEVPAFLELITAILSNLVRVGMLTLNFGAWGLAWAAVGITTMMALVFFALQVRDFFAPRLVWNPRLFATLLPAALPLMLNNVLNAFFFRFDMFIVKAFGGGSGNDLVAQYNQAYKITSIAMIIPSVVTFAVFPVLSRRSGSGREGFMEAQNRTLQVLLLLAFPLAMGMSVLAQDLVQLISGQNASDYLPISAHVLAILAWFLPLSFVNGLLQYVLIAIDRQRSITWAFLIGAVFNLVANLVFIPQGGLYAASVITILSEIVLLVVFLPLLRSENLAPPVFRLAWRPVLAALLMGAVMLAMKPVFGWIGAAIFAPLVYGGALWLLGAFGAEEQALVRRVLGRSG